MAKSKLGGKRPGAGRKPKLSIEEELWIGSEAHRRSEGSKPGQVERLIQKGVLPARMLARQAALSKIPLARRKKWAQLVTQGRKDSPVIEDITEEVRDIRADIAKLKIPPLTAPTPRLSRQEVLAQTAAKATERFGRPINARMVKRCLELFRAVQKRVQADV